MSTALKLLKNTAYHAGGRVWQIAVSLFLAPFILSYLGDEQFALWVLFWTFSMYFMFMDFGLGVSLVRETAQCEAKSNYLPVNQSVSSLVFLYVILGALVSLLSWFISPWVIQNMNISAEMKVFVSDILLWGGGIFALIGIVNTFAALLRGLQRYDQITKAMVYVSVPNVLGTYVVLELGYGITGLLWVITGVYVLQILLLLFYAKQLMPTFAFGISLLSWSQIKKMLPFGLRIQVSKFAELASYQADKILLALLLPIQFVTMYDLGSRIASLMRDLPYALTSAVFPAASELHEQENFKKLWQMYDRGSKYLLVVTLPMLFGLWLTAHLIIGMWLGHVSEQVYQSVLVLSFAYWVVISLAMSFSVGTGMGWSKPIMHSALLQAVLNIGLSYYLITALGFVGALYGTAIAISIANGILYFRFCREFERSLWLEAKRLWLVLRANVLAVIFCGAVVFFANQWLVWGDRFQSLMIFIAAVLVYGITYAWALRKSEVFDGEDLRLLGGKLPLMQWLLAPKQLKGDKH